MKSVEAEVGGHGTGALLPANSASRALPLKRSSSMAGLAAPACSACVPLPPACLPVRGPGCRLPISVGPPDSALGCVLVPAGAAGPEAVRGGPKSGGGAPAGDAGQLGVEPGGGILLQRAAPMVL